MTSLYIIAGDYAAAAAKLQDSDLPEEVIQDTLDGMAGELEEKCTNIGFVIRNLEAQSEAIKNAEKQMAERRKGIDAKVEHMKRYLLDNMKRTEKLKIESPYFTLSIAKNPASVKIDDESAIPQEYMRVIPAPPPAPDKALISQAIKDGVQVPGVHLEQSERLVIR